MIETSPHIGIEPLSTAKPIVVLGLGVAGRAAAAALRRHDYDVIVIEDAPNDDAVSFADDQGAEFLGAPSPEQRVAAFARSGGFLPSPGIPEHHAAFAEAADLGVPIISEFDLARWWDDRPIIAITGTDGKTSVTELTTALLIASGKHCVAVGNTDLPFADAIEDPSYDVFVVEASSFRLGHSARFAPTAAAWLNFSPDHLDVHASLERYEHAKAKIWEAMPVDGLVVAPVDDDTVLGHLPSGRRTVLVSSAPIEAIDNAAPADAVLAHVVDGSLTLDGDRLFDVEELPRAFPHDITNALTAAALARHVGATNDGIAEGLRSFTLPPHRIQFVASIGGVDYYNDSKATVPHAVVTAVRSFDRVVLIAGGRNKGLDLAAMAEAGDRAHTVVAIGDAADEIEAAFMGVANVLRATDMADAVDRASAAASPGDVVLLSPGCTSFDAYGSYGERGNHFIEIVTDRKESEEAT